MAPEKFVEHMSALYTLADDPELAANTILANPQAHIDALCEAGVLTTTHYNNVDGHLYRVVQPHIHSWYVSKARCMCGESHLFDDDRQIPVVSPDLP